ncbi:MAG: segregation/condensation protein A [Chloroflexota bacterium]|nr:segregation/condensation protein A [Chloroflexota bacterium]
MNTSAVETALLQGYQLRLPAFEGPFDVLLKLVERSQLPITDISLIAVTAQFMDYVGSLDAADPGLVAEFSSVGSRLIVLKSRSLLPRPPVEEREQVSDLARELIEYRAVKDMAALLGQRDVMGAGAFRVTPASLQALDVPAMRPLANHQPQQLVRAIRRRLSVSPAPALVVVARKLVSLRDMAERVAGLLRFSSKTTFATLGQSCTDFHEVRTAFLAVLVMARRQVIDVEQPDLFGPITLSRRTQGADTDSFLRGLSFED